MSGIIYSLKSTPNHSVFIKSIFVAKPTFFFSVESLTLTKMDRLTITQCIKIINTYYKMAIVGGLSKFSSEMKHILHLVGKLINKTGENPQVIEERILLPEKVIDWCAL